MGMGACGYVTPLMRKKQEIVQLAIELEEMDELNLFTELIFEYDLLEFYGEDTSFQEALKIFLRSYTKES
jgi:hypothetical protein